MRPLAEMTPTLVCAVVAMLAWLALVATVRADEPLRYCPTGQISQYEQSGHTYRIDSWGPCNETPREDRA